MNSALAAEKEEAQKAVLELRGQLKEATDREEQKTQLLQQQKNELEEQAAA